MALPKLDNFTAADQDLSTYNASWVDMYTVNAGVSGHLRIISNVAAADSGSGDSISYWTGDTFSNDQFARAIIFGPSANYAGLTLRCAGTQGGANNRGYLWIPSLGLAYTISAGGPSFVQIASGWTVGAPGDEIEFRVVGTTLTGYVNAVLAGTVVDSTHADGSPGLYISGGNNATLDTATLDNYPPTGGGGGGGSLVMPRFGSIRR